MLALRDFIRSDMTVGQVNENVKSIKITRDHLYAAINRVKPTASLDVLKQYEKIAGEFARFSVTEPEVPTEKMAKPEYAGYA